MQGSKRPRGDSWELTVSCGFDGEGKRIRYTKTLPPVLKDDKWVPLLVSEVDEELRKFIGQVKGSYAGRMTVGEYLDYWLNVFIDPKEIPENFEEYSGNTKKWYKLNVQKYLKPRMGSKLLRDLKSHDIKRVLNEIAADTKNEKISIHGIFRTLRTALETAVGVYIDINPAKNKTARPPRPSKADLKARHNFFTFEQTVKLLKTARQLWYEAPKKYEFLRMNIYGIFFMASVQSMRVGEICGLHWPQCDTEKRIIDITKQLLEPGMNPSFGKPKTEESIRKVRMAKCIAELLQEIRKYQEMAKAEAIRDKKPWYDYNLVFCQADGRPMNPKELNRRHLKNTIKKANEDAKPEEKLPIIRFHDLRGSSATLLFELGEDLKTIISILGHIDEQTAEDFYIRQKLKRQDKAISAIDKLFSKKMKPSTSSSKKPKNKSTKAKTVALDK